MPQVLDFVAQTYTAHSRPLNAARCVNFFAEAELQDAKSKSPIGVWGAPGIAAFSQCGAGPVKAFTVMNDMLYVVSGYQLWSLDQFGVARLLGSQYATDKVSIDNNGVQVVWVDGETGWVYQPGGIAQQVVAIGSPGDTTIALSVTGTITNGDALAITLDSGGTFNTTAVGTFAPSPSVVVGLADALPANVGIGNAVVDPAVTLAQITDPNFYASNTVTYFDGYFCFVRNGTKEFFLSPLFGIGPFDGALFASKEATSDLLLAIANSHEQLYLLGQKRIEVWYDAGNTPPTFPFQRSDGAIIQRGTLAPLSVVLEDNTLFFLGDDSMFYRLNGFIPDRLSNHAVEAIWATYPTLTDAQSLIYTVFGHKMLTVTFPTAAATWVCDLATRRWHERESWIGSSAATSIGRWRVNCAVTVFDRILVGDSQSGLVGQLSFEVFTEWGDTMRGLLDGPPIHKDRKRLFMKRFELDVESGIGLAGESGLEILPYTINAVTITQPTVLETAAALDGGVVNFAYALFDVWLLIPDGGNVTGILFSGPGFSVTAQNDATGSPEITITATDVLGNPIVSATYAFATWGTWVNLMVSLDTAAHRLAVWALTNVAGVLVESDLTPVSIAWGSTLPLANTAAWLLEPWPLAGGGGGGGGSPPVLQWTDGFESYPVGDNTITSPWTNTSPIGLLGDLRSLISDTVYKFGTQSLGLGQGGGSALGAGIVERTAPASGPTIGPVVTVDVWVYVPSGTNVNDPPVSNAPGIVLLNTGSGGELRLFVGGAGTCYINQASATPSSGAWFTFSLALDAWHRLTWSVDMAVSGTSTLIVDGGATMTFSGDTRNDGGDTDFDTFQFVGQFVASWGASPAAEIFFDDVSLYAGVYTPGAGGDNQATLANLYFGTPASFYDLSVAANRRAFVGIDGSSPYLGPFGQAPLDGIPPVFLTLNDGLSADHFADNAGSGGAFAITGPDLVIDGSSPPSGTYDVAVVPPPNTPQGAEPQVRLSVSDDGGRSWSLLQKWRSMGRQGEYLKRLRWLKLGMFRQRTIRLEITDPVRRNLIGFYMDVSEGLD